ncbi:MAG: DUF1848 family protein [Acidobacteriota bacterium]
MKVKEHRIISASRRTDLIAHFPDWLVNSLKNRKAIVIGPYKYSYVVDLNPSNTHTIVLWSKNFKNLIENRHNLLDLLKEYAQLYFLFTITGLGGTRIEPGVIPLCEALAQIDRLVEISQLPERISIRFDPIIYWREDGGVKSNLTYFEKIISEISKFGIKDIRLSFVQYYPKCIKRAKKLNLDYVDPPEEEKLKDIYEIEETVYKYNINIFSCSQPFLEKISFIKKSSCIDGNFLSKIHPEKKQAITKKDPSQRKECGCTVSIDIGSYTQPCPNACIYCYANPRI